MRRQNRRPSGRGYSSPVTVNCPPGLLISSMRIVCWKSYVRYTFWAVSSFAANLRMISCSGIGGGPGCGTGGMRFTSNFGGGPSRPASPCARGLRDAPRTEATNRPMMDSVRYIVELDARSRFRVQHDRNRMPAENITPASKPDSKREARSGRASVKIARLQSVGRIRRARRTEREALLRQRNGAGSRIPLLRRARCEVPEIGGICEKFARRPRRDLRDRASRVANRAAANTRTGAERRFRYRRDGGRRYD